MSSSDDVPVGVDACDEDDGAEDACDEEDSDADADELLGPPTITVVVGVWVTVTVVNLVDGPAPLVWGAASALFTLDVVVLPSVALKAATYASIPGISA